MKIEQLKVKLIRRCIEINIIPGWNLGYFFYSIQSKLTIKVDKWQKKSLNVKCAMLLESLPLNISSRVLTWG